MSFWLFRLIVCPVPCLLIVERKFELSREQSLLDPIFPDKIIYEKGKLRREKGLGKEGKRERGGMREEEGETRD